MAYYSKSATIYVIYELLQTK